MTSAAESWDGLCFAWVLKHARGGDVVAHGVVTPPGGSPFWHAWVERDGRAYDNTGGSMSLADHRATFKPEQVERYADHEALVYAVRTGHAGPWTAEERGPRPAAPRRRRGR